MEENKNINIQENQQNNQANNNEKNEKKGRGLFYFVIAFAVIIIAVVGATYAYFTATAQTTDADAVTAGSTQVELGIEVNRDGVNMNLIPASEKVVKYAYSQWTDIARYTAEDEENDGKSYCYEYDINGFGSMTTTCKTYMRKPQSNCIDDDGAAVCSAYQYTVVSTNTSDQTLSMWFGATDNQFANLWFMVYTDVPVIDEETGEQKVDEEGNLMFTRTRITEPKPAPLNANEEVKIEPIVVAATDTDGNVQYDENGNPIPDAEKSAEFEVLAYPTLTKDEPRKTYTIVLWIKELDDPDNPDDNDADDDQTAVDGRGRTFTGYVRISSGDGTGVTGSISAAENYNDYDFETIITSSTITNNPNQDDTTTEDTTTDDTTTDDTTTETTP